MQTKNEQIGFRVSADLKRELQAVAKREGRTLSQICEILVAGGLEAYKKDGSRFLQRMLSHYKKEPPE
jgi:predicted DNA-binding protein